MNKARLLIRRLLVAGVLAFLLVRLAQCPIWPYNYYRDYNLLKQAVLDAGCVTEQEIVNEDITLEEIDFTIRTTSGWKVTLSFAEHRNMHQLCVRQIHISKNLRSDSL